MSNPTDMSQPTHTTDAPVDPFAKHREAGDNPFAEATTERTRSHSSGEVSPTMTQVPLAQRDRRLSKEWDAAQTPPSRFQRPPHSIFATPASRDGHIARNKVQGFKEKVLELTGKKS